MSAIQPPNGARSGIDLGLVMEDEEGEIDQTKEGEGRELCWGQGNVSVSHLRLRLDHDTYLARRSTERTPYQGEARM